MSNQKGVLIRDSGGQVIEKRVYAGDVSGIENALKAEEVLYTIFDDEDVVFVNALTPAPPPSLEDRVTALETNVSSISKQINIAGPING